MSSSYDPRYALIDALQRNTESFELSNNILPNAKGLKAVFMLYGIQADLMKFAYNPDSMPILPKMPQPPNIAPGTPEMEARSMIAEYNEFKAYWIMLKKAHELKVSESDFFHITDYLNKYFKTLTATSSIKGNRFYSFTKNAEKISSGGFLSGLFNRGQRKQEE